MSKRIELHVPQNWNGILIVGERPNKQDFAKGIPFRSSYGLELQRLLSKVGIQLKECATTYAHKTTPKGNDIKSAYLKKTEVEKQGLGVLQDGKYITHEFCGYIEEIHKEIANLQPKFIITVGEGALFAVLGESGIDDFRGSMEWYTRGDFKVSVMPTHSPARVFKQTQLRYLVSRDLARVEEHLESGWQDPDWKIIINPDYDTVCEKLNWFLQRMDSGEKVELGVDIETRKRFYIGTLGFAWSETEALVIPFIRHDWRAYWDSAEQEFHVIQLCIQVLEHANARIAGQNYHYDAQYLARHWGVRSHIWCDTMLAHHVCFTADIPKALHVISSIYCDYHQYWKDESHAEGDDKWEPTAESWDNYLFYNGKDCCKTLDAARILMNDAIPGMEMERGWQFQLEMWQPLLKCMLRGNLYDWDERAKQRKELEVKMEAMENFMYRVVPEELYPRKKTPFFKSPSQLKELFYTVLNQPPVVKKNANKQYVPTTDDAALNTIAMREPILKPLCEAIAIYRSMRVFYDNFLTGIPDYDDYLRSAYLLAGTSTTRLASRGDVFDFGLNLQNLPKGDG
ncbi:3'-5'exonuclease and polymerase domain protein [Vibrio phage vB_VspS_VS-ABTNL-3]|nr:3'-5'exonuclease and polymerase domain protein [Vibrio phage vB_VspS_VS-ABTNL-3]